MRFQFFRMRSDRVWCDQPIPKYSFHFIFVGRFFPSIFYIRFSGTELKCFKAIHFISLICIEWPTKFGRTLNMQVVNSKGMLYKGFTRQCESRFVSREKRCPSCYCSLVGSSCGSVIHLSRKKSGVKKIVQRERILRLQQGRQRRRRSMYRLQSNGRNTFSQNNKSKKFYGRCWCVRVRSALVEHARTHTRKHNTDIYFGQWFYNHKYAV